MVGVPGRSKACHNCRHRRISCGGELPACQKCVKSRRVCTGYQRNHAFILSKDMVASQPASSNDRTVLADESDSGMVMVSGWRMSQRNMSIPYKPDRFLPSQWLLETTSLSPEITSRNVFRDRFFSLFVENHFPAGDSVRLTFGDRNDWVLQIISLPAWTPALEDAMLAVCTARLGRHAAHPALVRESLRLYTKCLCELRRDILDPSARNGEQSLAACLALLLYEVTECPGGTPDGYLAHFRGTIQLLQMRGAGAHTSGLAHSVFQILRIHIMFQGMVRLRKTFLSQPEWREIPWSTAQDGKAPFDRLVDIPLDIPDLSAQRQALESTTDPHQILSGALESIRGGQRMESTVEEWFNHFKDTVPGSLYHPELSNVNSVVDDSDSGKLFPVAFHFPAFIVGQSLVFYWVAVMSVHAHLCFTYEILARLSAMLDSLGRESLSCSCDGTEKPRHCLRHFTMELLPPLGPREQWPRGAAYNICRSVEYFLLDKTRGFGPAAVLPALTMVKGFWKHAAGDWSREIAWVNDMLSRIRESGNGIADALL